MNEHQLIWLSEERGYPGCSSYGEMTSGESVTAVMHVFMPRDTVSAGHASLFLKEISSSRLCPPSCSSVHDIHKLCDRQRQQRQKGEGGDYVLERAVRYCEQFNEDVASAPKEEAISVPVFHV